MQGRGASFNSFLKMRSVFRKWTVLNLSDIVFRLTPSDQTNEMELQSALDRENPTSADDSPRTSGQVNDLVLEFLQVAIARKGTP